jgi:hypothetical protein
MSGDGRATRLENPFERLPIRTRAIGDEKSPGLKAAFVALLTVPAVCKRGTMPEAPSGELKAPGAGF